MRFNFRSFGGSFLLVLFTLYSSATGQQDILSITTAPAGGGSNLINLTSVTVERPSGTETILVNDLIGINVLDYDNAIETLPFEGAILGTPDLPAGPAVGNRAALLDGDTAINTGINNPSEDGQTLAPAGDPFVLSGVLGTAGSPVDASRSASFDSSDYSLTLDGGFAAQIFFFNPGAGEDFSDLATLENGALDIITPPGATPPVAFDLSLFATAIDLSDLGFALGEQVDELRLLAQGPTFGIDELRLLAQGPTFGIDPSFIAALPPAGVGAAVPEPTSAVLITIPGMIALLRRRRQC